MIKMSVLKAIQNSENEKNDVLEKLLENLTNIDTQIKLFLNSEDVESIQNLLMVLDNLETKYEELNKELQHFIEKGQDIARSIIAKTNELQKELEEFKQIVLK